MARVALLPSLVVGACVALTSTSAQAATQKFALLVAAHEGGAGLPTLRYAGRDATRFADVLVDVGGFSRADIISVVDGDADTVIDLFDELEHRVGEAKHRGDDVVILTYYSGHAEAGELRLGQTRLSMQTWKEKLEASSADVRLAFIDSCGAGAITREKGAALAAPFVVKVDEELSAKGQVIIASSSANEVSQESDDIQGSFFTHYLASGLRGDADRDHDGRVTLDEAYAYAYGRTVAATSATRAGAQHPTYAFDLKGAGDVVLTQPGDAFVVVEFNSGLEGRYFVVDLDRQLFVAEIDKQKGGASKIALPKGQYAIKKRLNSHLLMTKVNAREKGVVVVDDAAMTRVSFQDDYAKGTPIMVSDTLRDEVGFSLSLGAGVQATVSGTDDGGLFPSTPLLVLDARLHHLFGSNVVGADGSRGPSFTLGGDLGFGRVNAVRVVDGGGLGQLQFPVQATQLQAGASLLYELPLSSWIEQDVTVGVGPRVGALFYVHEFTGESLPVQTYLTFTPGLSGFVAYSPVSFAHLEVSGRASYLAYNVDEVRSLGVFEAVASVWFDL